MTRIADAPSPVTDRSSDRPRLIGTARPMRPRVRLLNVDIDDVTMDELVEGFR